MTDFAARALSRTQAAQSTPPALARAAVLCVARHAHSLADAHDLWEALGLTGATFRLLSQEVR